MSWKIVFRVLAALALIAGVAAVGVLAYNAGVAQGLAQSGEIVLPEPGTGPVPYSYYGGPFFFHRPFGFGFGFLGCLFPLLLFFLFFALLRGFLWRGPWGWGHHGWGPRGPCGKDIPPMWRERAHGVFEEWHRQAHGEAPKPAEGETQSA